MFGYPVLPQLGTSERFPSSTKTFGPPDNRNLCAIGQRNERPRPKSCHHDDVGYRDENEAARARNEALEVEARALREGRSTRSVSLATATPITDCPPSPATTQGCRDSSGWRAARRTMRRLSQGRREFRAMIRSRLRRIRLPAAPVVRAALARSEVFQPGDGAATFGHASARRFRTHCWVRRSRRSRPGATRNQLTWQA